MPQGNQLMGYGEDGMEMVAWKKSLAFLLHPLRPGAFRALWAAAMSTGVILHTVEVAMGTELLMATQCLGPTAPDGLGGL